MYKGVWLKQKPWQISLLFLVFGFSSCNSSQNQKESFTASREVDPLTLAPAKVLPFMERVDSSKVYYLDEESLVQYKLKDGLPDTKVSGDVFFQIKRQKLPLYFHTSLMDIEILQTPASFRIDAYDKDEGQALEVLEGVLRVTKAYDSPFHEADTLRDKELYMINKSIDLSEKENLDNDLLFKWWEKYKNSLL